MKGIYVSVMGMIWLCLYSSCKQCNSTDPKPFDLYITATLPQSIDKVSGLKNDGTLIPCTINEIGNETAANLFFDPSQNQCSFIIFSSNPDRFDTITYHYTRNIRFEDVQCGFECIYENIQLSCPSLPNSSLVSTFQIELP